MTHSSSAEKLFIRHLALLKRAVPLECARFGFLDIDSQRVDMTRAGRPSDVHRPN